LKLSSLCFWRGDAGVAIALMANADEEKIKNEEHLDYLAGYLSRARPKIPNRALLASLGLGKFQRPGRKGQRTWPTAKRQNTAACLGQKKDPQA
jgi:hypothetical protein